MPNGTYGGVRGRKTKVGRKLLRFPPTRSKGLFLPLKTPFLGLFGGVFTGFYKNAKFYVIEY